MTVDGENVELMNRNRPQSQCCKFSLNKKNVCQ